MRGKVVTVRSFVTLTRITPAYAGKSTGGTESRPTLGDHPCVCGEKDQDRHKGIPYPGSPLRMRGKEMLRAAFPAASGITPAYAGKSPSSSSRLLSS